MSLITSLLDVYLGDQRIHEKIGRHRLRPFMHFARNGVWGTCADCPTSNVENEVYPELCKNFSRKDHRHDIEELLERYIIDYRSAARTLSQEKL